MQGYVDIYVIAEHEIGHTLSLGHHKDTLSVMSPYYRTPADRFTMQYENIDFREEGRQKIQALHDEVFFFYA